MQDSVRKFDEAVQCIAPIIRTQLLKLPDSVKSGVREIRLSVGAPIIIVNRSSSAIVGLDGRLGYIYNDKFPLVMKNDVKETLNIACGYSLHSSQSSLAQGFVTIRGGHRVGIGASAVVENGVVRSIKDVSFINVRIARECKGVANGIYDRFFKTRARSIIIAGEPSSGKTTILRDLARLLSSISSPMSYRVCVVDERDEIAAMYNGQAQNDIGINSCVLSGFPKAEGIMRAVRALSPQVIICDEIGTNDECDAVAQGLNSGVSFVVTLHAGSISELVSKPQFKRLANTGVFDCVIILDGAQNPCSVKEFYKMEELHNEVRRTCSFTCGICSGGQSFFNED